MSHECDAGFWTYFLFIEINLKEYKILEWVCEILKVEKTDFKKSDSIFEAGFFFQFPYGTPYTSL